MHQAKKASRKRAASDGFAVWNRGDDGLALAIGARR